MNYHHDHETFKIHRACIVLVVLLTCLVEYVVLDDNHCNYIFSRGCRSTRSLNKKYGEENINNSCSVEDIEDDVKFTVQLRNKRERSGGIVKVNFSLPNVKCNYEVALLVNSSIRNSNDCKNHVFHKTNSYENEIHSTDRTICVSPHSNSTGINNCEKEQFSMWYEHIFTGCYALRFTVDGSKFSILGSRFIVTNYIRTEIVEPKFRCYYENLINNEKSDKELVTFGVSVSVEAGTSGLLLSLTPMSYQEETKENACVRYSERPLHTVEFNMEDSTNQRTAALKNCSLTSVELNNATSTKAVECNFLLATPRNVSYCLKIALDDERCNRQTIWKPPPDDKGGKPACAWLQSCTRIFKNTSIIEYNGVLRQDEETNLSGSNLVPLLPIVITIIMIVLVIMTTTIICRGYLRNPMKRIYLNKNSRNVKITRYSTENDSVETTDDEMLKKPNIIDNDEKDKSEPIILLYARGSAQFMNLMSDFRDILRINCGYCVRDWYDASEWDVVARIGPSAWVTDLLRKNHRALWVDTPRIRTFFDLKWQQKSLKKTMDGVCEIYKPEEEPISDFRDVAFPNVLDLAKRNAAPIGYNKHFVMRLEGFEANNERQQDPFEDLSPHTRYLIPHHLTELCSHLSSCPSNINNQRSLKKEEARLRERLMEMRNEKRSEEL